MLANMIDFNGNGISSVTWMADLQDQSPVTRSQHLDATRAYINKIWCKFL